MNKRHPALNDVEPRRQNNELSAPNTKHIDIRLPHAIPSITQIREDTVAILQPPSNPMARTVDLQTALCIYKRHPALYDVEPRRQHNNLRRKVNRKRRQKRRQARVHKPCGERQKAYAENHGKGQGKGEAVRP
jgi:hypothetical protein